MFFIIFFFYIDFILCYFFLCLGEGAGGGGGGSKEGLSKNQKEKKIWQKRLKPDFIENKSRTTVRVRIQGRSALKEGCGSWSDFKTYHFLAYLSR